MSSDCSSCHSTDRSFRSRSSPSYANLNRSITLSYGQGKATGDLSSDTLQMAGVSLSSQEFVLVTKDKDFDNMKADGIIGMGIGYSSQVHHPVVYNMYVQGLIENQIFSVFLSDEESDVVSCATFGDVDLEKYSDGSEVQYLKVIADGFWSVRLNGIVIAGKEMMIGSLTAIIDTGSSLLIGPDYEVQQVLDAIEKGNDCDFDQYLFCECGESEKFPDIEFHLGEKVFSLTFKNYMIKNGSKCQVLISSNKELNRWILGDVFIRRYYSIFDLENERMGLVRSINKDELKVSSDTWWNIAVWILILVPIIILGYLGYVGYQKYRSRRRNVPVYINMTDITSNQDS